MEIYIWGIEKIGIMNENRIELKSINDILGMRFFIPSYQRGYRWTKQQVKDLLNDIWEFCRKEKDPMEFYCLQPLVVKEKDDGIMDQIKTANNIKEVKELLKGYWEVIDGQQRLTTIFILLSVLKSHKYSLEYETRYDSKDYLNSICSQNECDSNIDYFHMWKAKETITRFFNNKEVDTNKFKENLLNNVKFIWYESIDEEPIKVFTRLNIGKIPLTNAELIKALLLNSSNFTSTGTDSLKLRQQEIASEWDNIEYTLQNNEFWLFIHKLDYDRPTRIDFIFDLIVKKNIFKIKEDKIGTDEYRTFRYFYEYFQENKNKNEEGVKHCWDEVKRYFQIFREWYNNMEMYHYVGYLIALDSKLEDILKLWVGDNDEFINNLKHEITKKLKSCKDLNNQYELEGYPKKTECRPLLLLHNVQTVINQANINHKKYNESIFYKYPFHLHKIEGWDVEHIDSNTENTLSDKDSQNEFLLNIYNSVDDNTKEKIATFINDPLAKNWSDFANYTKKTNDSLSREEKNQIMNFALLDSSTNRSYGNSIFSAKRRIITGKDKGKYVPIPIIKKNSKGNSELDKGKETNAKSAFIPPCTKYVFLKYYSPLSTDYNYWTKPDAQEYKKDIYNVLKDFGVTLSEQNNE